jgi:hypothetical protein
VVPSTLSLQMMTNSSGIMVEHLPDHPNVKGSSPASAAIPSAAFLCQSHNLVK